MDRLDIDGLPPYIFQLATQLGDCRSHIPVSVELDASYSITDLLRRDHNARVPHKVV